MESESNWKVSASHSGIYTGGKLEFSKDGSYFACMCDSNVNFVDRASGLVMFKLQKMDDLTDEDDNDENIERITTFSLHPNGKEIVSASSNQLIRRWNFAELLTNYSDKKPSDANEEIYPTMLKVWRGHDGPILCAEFHHSGDMFATGSSDKSVKVWNLKGGFCTHNFLGHISVVTTLQFNPNPRNFTLASSDFSGGVFVWNLMLQTNQTNSKKHKKSKSQDETVQHISLKNHVSCVTSVLFGPKGVIFTVGRDKVLNVWHEYSLITTFPVMESVEGMVMLPEQFSHDYDCVLVTAGEKGVIRTWGFLMQNDSGTTNRISCLNTQYVGNDHHAIPYTAIQYSRGDLIGCTFDNVIRYLNPQTLARTKQMVGYTDEIVDLQYLALDAEHPKVVMANSTEHVAIVDLKTFDHTLLSGHSALVLSISVSRDGKYIVTGSKDNDARLWDAETHECVAICSGHTESVTGVGALEIQGAMIMKLRNVKRSKKNDGVVDNNAKVSPPCVVTVSSDKTLKYWSFKSGEVDANTGLLRMVCRHTKIAHDKVVNCVCVTPNTTMLATGSQDKTIKIWQVSDFSLRGVLQGHRRGVWNVQFSPVERCLASASADKTVRIWSMSDFTCIGVLEGHAASVLRVQYVGAGTTLMSAASDGILKVWTISSSQCIGTMDVHTDRVWALTAPTVQEGAPVKRVISGGGDGKLLIWDDCTEMNEALQAQQEEEMILAEQQMFTSMRRKEYVRAATRALELSRPHQLRMILESMIRDALPGQDMAAFVVSLDGGQVKACWELARDWNTYSRNCYVAQVMIDHLLQIDIPLGSSDAVKGVVDPLVAYSERHFQRLDTLLKDSYLVDHALACMGEM